MHRRFTVALTVLFVVLAIVIPSFAATGAEKNRQESWEIVTFHGSSEEKGIQYGDHFKEAIERNLELFWEEVDQQGYSIKEVLETGQEFAENIIQVEPGIIEKIRGIADSTGIAYEDLLAFNALEEIVFDEGCTTLLATGSATRDGKAYFHKNRDSSTSLEQVVIEVIGVYENHNYIALVSAGSTSVSIGINEHGVSTGNTAQSTWDTGSGLGNLTINRKILREASSASEAVDVVESLHNNRSSGSTYLVADANEAVIIETTHSAMAVKWVVDEAAAITNHYTLPEMLEYCTRETGGSQIRKARANELLQENYGEIDVDVMIDISQDRNEPDEDRCISRPRTVAAATFDSTNLLMYAQLGRTGTVPVELYDLGKILVKEYEEFIQAAEEAINNIPVELTMEHMMEIRIPRSLVDKALSLGAGETDIPNLSDLEEAEEAIRALYDDNYMRHSYADLPVPLPEHEAAWNLFITRAERWWEGGHYVNGMTWLPLGSVSTSYSRVGDTYPDGRWVEYDISDGGFTRVKFYAGIAELSSRTEYPLTFQVHGDGILLEEKILEYGEYAQFFLVDIEDVDMIRFSYYAHEGVDDDRANELVFVEPQFLIPINDAMLDAIDAAEAAIDALPDHISLLDIPDVKEARALVDAAVELGVELERPRPAHVEGSVYQNRIEGLPELVAAEETITDLYHHYYEQQSLHVLGDPGSDHRNSDWLIDFDNPERWEVHTEKWEDRGFVNFRGFAPLKVFTAGLSAIEHGPIYAEWDISEMDYDYIEGYFGLSDACTGGARFPVDFRIYGDGHLLFESHIRYGADAAFYCLDVEDVTWLRFEYSAENVSSSGFAGWQVFVEPIFHHSADIADAIAGAEEAIDNLPAEITMDDKDDVQSARAKANNVIAIGAEDTQISNLSVLEAAEAVLDNITAGYGDILNNGSINISDAILVMRHIVGLIDLTDTDYYPEGAYDRARVAGDEILSINDAAYILRHVIGLIDSFPAND